MSNSLKHQFKEAIEHCFIPGADKHAIKRDKDQKNKNMHRIYSYAERETLIDIAMCFVNFLREEFPDVRYVKQIKPRHCTAFLQSKPNNCTQATIVQYSRKLNKLSKIVNHHYYIHTNYKADIPKSNRGNEIRNVVMTREDLKIILNRGKDCTGKNALLLTAETGLRVTSLVKLKVTDVDFENKTLFIYQDKGKRSRTIPLNEAAFNHLKEFCKGKEKWNYIFSAKDNNKKHIKNDSVNKFLRTNALKCGITKYNDAKTGVHSIRKMVALELYYQKRAEGQNYIQAATYAIKYIGHSSYRKDLVKRYLPGITED